MVHEITTITVIFDLPTLDDRNESGNVVPVQNNIIINASLDSFNCIHSWHDRRFARKIHADPIVRFNDFHQLYVIVQAILKAAVVECGPERPTIQEDTLEFLQIFKGN